MSLISPEQRNKKKEQTRPSPAARLGVLSIIMAEGRGKFGRWNILKIFCCTQSFFPLAYILGPYISAKSIHIFIIKLKKVHLVVLETFCFPCFSFTRKCRDVTLFLGWMLGAPKRHDKDLLEQKDNHGELRPQGYFFCYFIYFVCFLLFFKIFFGQLNV